MTTEAIRRAIDTPHPAQTGETFHQRHLAFESLDARARALGGTHPRRIDALAPQQLGLRQVLVMVF
jgi:hypothetical protein